ncbi:alpha/beta fold hydrolase [Arthrobacter sp. M4]|uniref:alpha/beta fold hydrolase n=1 Tax=Arthrobacter sp. M4 TaxID=218160 RepID=UPI001CDD0A5B|nr:alpha/beta hydrolase [Arthrobacter sp. M4]MCA4133179.1 alpha/beta hydrolase [Arthrobacter sp. M4]
MSDQVSSDPASPPLLLLHATGETAADWDLVASRLCSKRTVIAVDLRGHGASDWPGVYSLELMARDILGLLGSLELGEVDLVGHSLGGLVACLVAANAPVRRLVLEDVGVPHSRPPATPARPEGELDFDWAVVEQVRPEIDSPDPYWPTLMGSIKAATLVIGGGPASPIPQQHLDELVSIMQRGSLVTIDAGHLIHSGSPNEFTAAVQAFLDN